MKSTVWAKAVNKLLFQNVDATGIGDPGGLLQSVTAGSLFVALHTADPGVAGGQTTSEATFTSYARVAVARSAAGWTEVERNSIWSMENAADTVFPANTGTAQTVTHLSIGKNSAGAGDILKLMTLSAPIIVQNGMALTFLAGEIVFGES